MNKLVFLRCTFLLFGGSLLMQTKNFCAVSKVLHANDVVELVTYKSIVTNYLLLYYILFVCFPGVTTHYGCIYTTR